MLLSHYVFEKPAEKRKFDRFEEEKEPEAKRKGGGMQFWKTREQRSRHRQAPEQFEQRGRGRTPETFSKMLVILGEPESQSPNMLSFLSTFLRAERKKQASPNT